MRENVFRYVFNYSSSSDPYQFVSILKRKQHMALLVVPMIEEFDLIIAFLVIIPNLKMKNDDKPSNLGLSYFQTNPNDLLGTKITCHFEHCNHILTCLLVAT